MKNNTMIFLAFAVGAAVGGMVGRYYAKAEYERLAQEELAEMREEAKQDEPELERAAEEPATKKEYIHVIQEERYAENPEDIFTKPYVIPPDEFGEVEGYETISLTYYSNYILADENDEIVEDVENTVGSESLSHFGEYEDDSVFVRNDMRKCDYEILLDLSPYKGAV